jgi:hypothetical protein
MSSGAVAISNSTIGSRLPSSLPSTISSLRRSVSSNKTNVRRSFSWATALAADSAAKNKNRANSTKVSTWNSSGPKRADSPSVAERIQPPVASQAVTPMIHSAPR